MQHQRRAEQSVLQIDSYAATQKSHRGQMVSDEMGKTLCLLILKGPLRGLQMINSKVILNIA